MSFFDDLTNPISLAKIPGLTGDPNAVFEGFETAIQLNNIDFTMDFAADQTDFDGLFDGIGSKGGNKLDYEPTFSVFATPQTLTGRELLLNTVDANVSDEPFTPD